MNKKYFGLFIVILSFYSKSLPDEKQIVKDKVSKEVSIKEKDVAATKPEIKITNTSVPSTQPVVIKIKSWDENVTESLNKFCENENGGWKKLKSNLSQIKISKNKDIKTIGLEQILNTMQNFNPQQSFQPNESVVENFYILLSQLSNKMFFVSSPESILLKKTLNEWFACSSDQSQENDVEFNNDLGTKLDYMKNKANEYFSISFISSGPIDFSSSINKSFELAELLMQRLDFIERFKEKNELLNKKDKATGDSPKADQSDSKIIQIPLSEIIAKCLVLQVFERFFMQSEKYEKELSKLSDINFNEMLFGNLISFKQVQEMVESPTIVQMVDISQTAHDCLNFILTTLWHGVEPEIINSSSSSVEITKESLNKKIVSVKNFLNKLKEIALKIQSKKVKGSLEKEFNAVNLFLNEAQLSEKEKMNFDFSLQKFLEVLKKLNLSEMLNLEK